MHPRLQIRRNQVASTRTPSASELRSALERADQMLAEANAKRIARRGQRRARRVFWVGLGCAITAGCAALAERLA